MSTYVKGLLQQEFKDRFAEVGDFLVIETKGVGGNENNKMRGVLKEKGIKLIVVKNAMMCRALEELGRPEAMKLFSVGPCTVAYGGDSVVDIAKEIAGWVKTIEAVNIKGAFVDGLAMDVAAATELAKMPNRVQLQGAIVMLAKSPGARLAGAIASPGAIIAGCIESLVEKLEEKAA